MDAIVKQLRMYNACVLDEATRELVALTNVQVATTWPEVGEQHNTGVLPAYRGQKLAKLVKTEMALWLRQEHPELRLISTWNACENDSMLAVNSALGYGNRERWVRGRDRPHLTQVR